MAGRIPPPRRLRRRLAIAFVLVAVISSGALALGSYLFVYRARHQDAIDHAVSSTRLNLTFAAHNLPPRPTASSVANLLDAYSSGGFDVVTSTGQPTRLTLGLPQVPSDLERMVARGRIAYEATAVQGVPYVVTGGRVPGHGVALYFFFSQAAMAAQLSLLRKILLAGWATIAVLSAIIGTALARHTLEPVARASEAAQSLAEGLLETRLPPGGRDEFGAWAASFNQMAAALESKVAALSRAQERERRFTSDVSHELRTPLAALVAEASLLGDHLEAIPSEARRPAELLIADVERLRRLVADLMEVSRLDAHQEDVVRQPLELGSFIRSIVQARGCDGRVAVSARPVEMLGDRRRLERIVGNLVDNALEHGGSRAAVDVRRDGETAVIEVSDDGPGVRPEDVPHLFERFYKTDRARSGPGSGLGLAIARENARLLGGDIGVQTEPGRGARFTVRLPLEVAESLPDGEGRVAPGAKDQD